MEQNSPLLIDVHSHIGVEIAFYLRGFQPYGLDWPTLSGMSERGGIDRVVVFPMPTYLGEAELGTEAINAGIAGIPAGVPYAFENRRQAVELARFAGGAVRALPLWMVDPGRGVAGQVAALRSLRGEYPCYGLKIQGTIIRSRVAELMGVGSALLDLAEEWDVPFLIHSSIHPDDAWSQAADILDVVRSRPGVRFILAHSCRFDLESLDAVAELPNAWFDCSAHLIHCRLAVQDSPVVAKAGRRFATDYRDPARVLADLAAAYPESFCWGSDAPFDSYVDDKVMLWGGYEAEVAALRQLDPDVQTRIARDNTRAFLKLAED